MYYDTINSDNPIVITCLLGAQFLSGSPQEILHQFVVDFLLMLS